MFNRFLGRQEEEGLEQRLKKLEKSATRAANGYETQHLLQAAELCVTAGDADRALRYFGQVLDRYLESGRFEAAEAVCRRMLRLAPRAVRVRCTRVWLAAAKGSAIEVRDAVMDYVLAGTMAEQENMVARQLEMLAEASSCEVREIAAEALLNLGAAREADHWLGTVFAERNGLTPPSGGLASHEWGQRMLEATFLRPEQAQPV